MNSNALFGRYWDSRSVIHGLDARSKLLAVLVLVVVLFVADNWAAMLFDAIAVLALFVVARIPIMQALRSVVPVMFIALLAALVNIFFVKSGTVLLDWGWLYITSGGLDLGIFVGVRLILLLLLGSLLTMSTTTLDITRAIERLLGPLARIGVPVHEFAFVMGTALRFLPQFAGELHTIRQAQISRGSHLSSSPFKGITALTNILVPLFASVFRHADTLALAMDARCYQEAGNRTHLHEQHVAKQDAVCALVILGIAVVTVLLAQVC